MGKVFLLRDAKGERWGREERVGVLCQHQGGLGEKDHRHSLWQDWQGSHGRIELRGLLLG